MLDVTDEDSEMVGGSEVEGEIEGDSEGDGVSVGEIVVSDHKSSEWWRQ